MRFSSFGVPIKIPQGVYFAFSAPLCQKSDITQPNPQMYHPANGNQEWGKHRRAIDSSQHSKSHKQCQTAWTQRGESISRKQTFAVKVVPSSWIKEHLLCLVPSLHQACPMQVPHHRLVLQYPPFAQRKYSL